MTHTDELLTAQQAADLIGITVNTLYHYRQFGTGPLGWREGKCLVFPRSGVEFYLARRRERTMRGEGAA